MAPHVVDAEVTQFPIPSYCIKCYPGADDGSTLGSISDLEHALTSIAENRLRTRMQFSLDIFKQGSDLAEQHSPSTVL